MGADSQCTAGYNARTLKESKIVRVGEFLIGQTGDLRLLNLLRYRFRVPARQEGQDDLHYLNTSFVDALRSCFKDAGFATTTNGQDSMDGALLVGWRGRLFKIGPNYCILETATPYFAVGCGDDFAVGALTALEGQEMAPEERLRLALESRRALEYRLRCALHL